MLGTLVSSSFVPSGLVVLLLFLGVPLSLLGVTVFILNSL
jgi:hypothetical protein